MRKKAVICIATVLAFSCAGFGFAQDNSASSSNTTGAQKHEVVAQHRIQQHQENVAHRVDHKAEWEKKMAERRAEREKRITERRVAREKHMAEVRAEREKRIAERKARFHQHHTASSNAASSEHPQ
jgi:hypothetical protein